MNPHLDPGISPPQTLRARCGGRLRHRQGRPGPLPWLRDFPQLLFPENRDEIKQMVTKSTAFEVTSIILGMRPSRASFSWEGSYSVSLVPLPALPAGSVQISTFPFRIITGRGSAGQSVKDGSAAWTSFLGPTIS
jgi:hypothetical protein